MVSSIPKAFAGCLDVMCSLYCWYLLTPIMLLMHRLWKPLNHRSIFDLMVSVSIPYSSTDRTQGPYTSLLVLTASRSYVCVCVSECVRSGVCAFVCVFVRAYVCLLERMCVC